MSDGVHLLVPLAYSTSPGCGEALNALKLPHLARLLARLRPMATDKGHETTLSLPHERVLARLYGLPAEDGLVPWAAWELAQSGRDPGSEAWAWITPCHWRVATDHVQMGHPHDLQLDAASSQLLLAAMRPYFEQDGITLTFESPTRWLAKGEIFRGLATASLDRVAGRTLDDWMPRAEQAKTLRRLQQEMQMLLYTHEVNDERIRGGRLPVNSFWASGAGALPPAAATSPPAGLQIVPSLRQAALVGDWREWASAWQHLDDHECVSLAGAVDAGEAVSLTLCGERNAQTWRSDGKQGWARRLGRLFARHNPATLLQAL